ncbi:hypothetical protein D4R99_02980 [bacterium]|nr:MAG: hypothetical protein D4R99_02980 [bacterium]
MNNLNKKTIFPSLFFFGGSIIPNMEKDKITWQAKEFLYYKKTTDWYWYFGTIVIGLMAFSFYVHDILFIFVIGIGAFTMLLYATKVPETINYQATSQGIIAGKTQYPYSSLVSFWIPPQTKEGEEKILLLHSQKTTMPLFIIPLGNANREELRDFLFNFIDEKREDLPLGQIFMNWVGF